MIIFEIISKIYTSKTGTWILELEDSEVQPFLINRFLAMNDNIRQQVRWLDSYTFSLPPLMWLSLAWSVIPKSVKAPYHPYIKQKEDDGELVFLYDKVRKHYKLSDNDFNSIKSRLKGFIMNDLVNWFSFYGVEKSHWKKYFLDFNKIKEFGDKKSSGLSRWGL